MAGGVAGSITSVLTYPLDYAQTRLSSDIGNKDGHKKFLGMWDCIHKSYKANGIKGPFTGVVVTSFGCFFYRGLYFGVYDIIKSRLPKETKKNPMKYRLIKLIASNIAVQSGALGAYPIDTVRRQLTM